MGSHPSKPAYKKPGPIKDIVDDALSIVNAYLTLAEKANLSATNRNFNRFFKKHKHHEEIAAYLILTGRPQYLLQLLEKNPQLFFVPIPRVQDAEGQTFYNVSPADLVYFLCDDDMRDRIQEFAHTLPEDQQAAFFAAWQAHQASRGKGGADLVFVRDEHLPSYRNIKQRRGIINISGENYIIIRGVLTNPDGLVCWQRPEHPLAWFYANPQTAELEPIDLQANLSAPNKTQYELLITRMTQMETLTARRSSNEEHQLFQAIMRHQGTQEPIRLIRQGIRYEQDGIEYIDTHHDFNRLLNVYIKCMRLYDTNQEDEAQKVWKSQLGHEQKKVMWLVQTYCQPQLPFYPLPENFKENPLQRSFEIFNVITKKNEPVFDVKSGRFSSAFGLDDANIGFALYKAAFPRALGTQFDMELGEQCARSIDFRAITERCKQAISNIEAPIVVPKPEAGMKAS